MAPKVKVTKEDILKTALDLLREQGEGAINVRRIAERIGCSTQPICFNFATMEELREALRGEAYKAYLGFIEREVASGKYPAYKAYGMAYMRFALEEKELFRFLYMCERSGEESMDASRAISETRAKPVQGTEACQTQSAEACQTQSVEACQVEAVNGESEETSKAKYPCEANDDTLNGVVMSTDAEKKYVEAPDFSASVEMIMEANGISRERAERMHFEMWSFVHGIGTMLATSFLNLDWETISQMTSDVYHGLQAVHTTQECKG